MGFGYELLADALAQACGGRVFGLMGDGNMTTLAHLIDSTDCTYYGARHEAAAVSMAAGFARATQGLGVCTVTHGPGFTNALTALDAAAKDHTPVLVFVGELPAGEHQHAQRVDHERVAAAVGVHSEYVGRAEEIPAVVATTAERARRDRAPVVLRVAYEALNASVSTPAVPEAALARTASGAGADRVAPASVARAADLLRRARRPFVLVGRGAVLADVREAAGALADRTGAVLGTTLGALGACAEHERAVGLVGGFAHPAVAQAAADSDVVVALGASLNEFTTAHGSLFSGAELIHADIDAGAVGRYRPAAVSLLGDLKDTLVALLAELADGEPRTEYDLDAVKHLAVAARQWELVDRSDAQGLDPRTVVTRFDAVFPADRAVVIDGGHLIEWAARHLRPGDARYWLPSLGAGSIGLSTSTGIGVAIGSGRPTVVVVGDGSLMMSLSDLDIAVRSRLPVCFLVMNDRAYGAEVHKLRRYGLPTDACLFETPSLAQVAEALGVHALTLRTPDDLTQLDQVDWERQLSQGPVLIDAVVTPSVVSARLAS